MCVPAAHLQGHGQLRVQVGVHTKLKALTATTDAATTTTKGGTTLSLQEKQCSKRTRVISPDV